MAHGMHFFMNPGPTNIPDRILRAMDRGAIDFTGAEFKAISEECFAGLKRVFKTEGTILAYAATGHGAWEAALVNLFSPGDRILVVESGFFSLNWGMRGEAFGLEVETLPKDWRHPADPAKLEARLREDPEHRIKAVLLVHCETSTGVINPVAELRRAIDAAGHPALFLVDTISSLASIDFRMDEWGVDVVVAGSQKGLMLPTGMAFTAVSATALEASAHARLPRVYWDWQRLLGEGSQAYWNGTAPVHFFYGLREALRMLEEEGLDNVFARHQRLAEATRCAVRAWTGNRGPEIYSIEKEAQSNTITAVLVPEGCDADAVRQTALDRFNVSLGGGLDRLKGRVFRIGHLGDLNEPMLIGAIAAVEMALGATGVPHGKGGVNAAIAYLGRHE
jgi:alanine-glyoxylate transaminase / serine-glyoxylate transaminase / serine-pyruvate transaminase